MFSQSKADQQWLAFDFTPTSFLFIRVYEFQQIGRLSEFAFAINSGGRISLGAAGGAPRRISLAILGNTCYLLLEKYT